jgi:hypothetical protein
MSRCRVEVHVDDLNAERDRSKKSALSAHNRDCVCTIRITPENTLPATPVS